MEINICFAANNRYVPHAAVLVTSIMENKAPEDELSIHFFSDKTTLKVQETFRQMSKDMGFNLSIYPMSDEMFAKFPTFNRGRTAYFRLSMHRALPNSLKTILYLDVDMIVMTSLSNLCSTDISEHYAAVVPDPFVQDRNFLAVFNPPPYFNSGMMLLNLEKYRSEHMEDKAMQFGNKHLDLLHFPDQDILNGIFEGKVVYLTTKYNDMGRTVESDTSIAHYGLVKPWHYQCNHPHKAFYWKYACKTPFYRQIVFIYYFSYVKVFLRRMQQVVKKFVIEPLKTLSSAQRVRGT